MSQFHVYTSCLNAHLAFCLNRFLIVKFRWQLYKCSDNNTSHKLQGGASVFILVYGGWRLQFYATFALASVWDRQCNYIFIFIFATPS